MAVNVASDNMLLARRLESNIEVELVLANSGILANRVTSTCLMLCNQDHFSNLQICAYYCSAIVALFPGLLPLIKETLTSMGAKIIEINERNMAENGFVLEKPEEVPKVLGCLGQAILILYKNISPRSYANFMKARAWALKAVAGYLGNIGGTEADDVVIRIEKASVIRTMLVSN